MNRVIKCRDCDNYLTRVIKNGYYYDTTKRCEAPICYATVPDPINGTKRIRVHELEELNAGNDCIYLKSDIRPVRGEGIIVGIPAPPTLKEKLAKFIAHVWRLCK